MCAIACTQIASASDLNAKLNWLASGWGETDKDGAPDRSYSCSYAHDVPAALKEQAKGRAIYSSFYDGVLAFVNAVLYG